MTFFCYYFVTLLGGFKNNMYLCSGNKFILIMAKKKKVIKAKEPIRMRIKELKGGNRSIYLDTYLNGKHHYEFLKMYLVPEVDETAKTLNAIPCKRQTQSRLRGFWNSLRKEVVSQNRGIGRICLSLIGSRNLGIGQ